jgi:hypothetical protein
LLLAALLLGCVGCSGGSTIKQARISVTGKVARHGQPVGNVMVSFHPLDEGYVASFPVNPDGTFRGELIAGTYSYYVGKSTAPTSEAVLRTVDPKFLEPNLDRRIAVVSGQELLLALD